MKTFVTQCYACNGCGYDDSGATERCGVCGGDGVVTQQINENPAVIHSYTANVDAFKKDLALLRDIAIQAENRRDEAIQHRDRLIEKLSQLRDVLEPTYSLSPEGRQELARIDAAICFHSPQQYTIGNPVQIPSLKEV